MIRQLLGVAALPLLVACADTAEEADTPVVETEVMAPTAEDAAELEPGDRSLANPALDSVTRPRAGASIADDDLEAGRLGEEVEAQ